MAIEQINVNGTVYTLDALPAVTSSDAGKVLQVNASGEWVAATVSVAPSVESVSDSFRFYDFTNGLSGLGNNGYDDDGNALTPLTALQYLEKYTISPTNTAYSAALLSRFNPVVSGHSGAADKSILAEIEMPDCAAIPADTFKNCRNLISTSFPACTNVGASAFWNCSRLVSASFPACASIQDYVFGACGNLVSVNFPVCTSIGYDAFANCTNLVSVNFPLCASIGEYAFNGCSSLISANFPLCMNVESYTFQNGVNEILALETLTLNSSCVIKAHAFCDVLDPTNKTFRLYLRGNSMGTCNDAAFGVWETENNTNEYVDAHDKYPGTIPGLEIYVPASLLNDFKTIWAGGAFANNIYALTD